MKHSVEEYLQRLPLEKLQVVWSEWGDEQKRPDYVTAELMQILLERIETAEVTKTCVP